MMRKGSIYNYLVLCQEFGLSCRFWSEPTAYTPESRTEVHNYMAEKRKEKDKEPGCVCLCVTLPCVASSLCLTV